MEIKIKDLNKLMNEFYEHWEKQDTEEMFLQLSGQENTDEIKLSIEKNNKRLLVIENFINDKENFSLLINNWNNIDSKILNILISTFEINIKEFLDLLEKSKVSEEVKSFFKKWF